MLRGIGTAGREAIRLCNLWKSEGGAPDCYQPCDGQEVPRKARQNQPYSSSTSRSLDNTIANLSRDIFDSSTVAGRRNQEWKRKQALKRSNFRRRQAESKARRDAMLAKARKLNADFEACRKNNKVCSRGTRQ